MCTQFSREQKLETNVFFVEKRKKKLFTRCEYKDAVKIDNKIMHFLYVMYLYMHREMMRFDFKHFYSKMPHNNSLYRNCFSIYSVVVVVNQFTNQILNRFQCLYKILIKFNIIYLFHFFKLFFFYLRFVICVCFFIQIK